MSSNKKKTFSGTDIICHVLKETRQKRGRLFYPTFVEMKDINVITSDLFTFKIHDFTVEKNGRVV